MICDSGEDSPIFSKRASSRSAWERTSSGMPASSIFVRYSSMTEAVVLAELLADRLELLAQHVLALLLVRLRLDVVAHLLAHLQLGQPLALELDGELDPLDDVEVSSRRTRSSKERSGA